MNAYSPNSRNSLTFLFNLLSEMFGAWSWTRAWTWSRSFLENQTSRRAHPKHSVPARTDRSGFSSMRRHQRHLCHRASPASQTQGTRSSGPWPSTVRFNLRNPRQNSQVHRAALQRHRWKRQQAKKTKGYGSTFAPFESDGRTSSEGCATTWRRGRGGLADSTDPRSTEVLLRSAERRQQRYRHSRLVGGPCRIDQRPRWIRKVKNIPTDN